MEAMVQIQETALKTSKQLILSQMHEKSPYIFLWPKTYRRWEVESEVIQNPSCFADDQAAG